MTSTWVVARVCRLHGICSATLTAGTVVAAVVIAALAVSVLAAANPGAHRLTPSEIGSVGGYRAVQLSGTVLVAVCLPLLAACAVIGLAARTECRRATSVNA